MPIVKVNQRILWKSYKIVGKWYEGVIIKIIQKKHFEELHIKTELPGIHQFVVRPNTRKDIKIIKNE